MSEPSGGIPNDLRYPVVPVCHCKQPDGPKDLKILATVTKCGACQSLGYLTPVCHCKDIVWPERKLYYWTMEYNSTRSLNSL